MAAPPVPRPGRALAVIAVAVVALYAWMVISGITKPRLGLDLQGGTTVTLVPRLAAGESGTVTTQAIQQAVAIIQDRVNGLGVAEAEVTTQGSGAGSTIVISVPGVNQGRIVDLVGQTAQLSFRPVLAAAGPAPTAATSSSPSPSASGSASAKPSASASPSASGNGRGSSGLAAATTSPSPSASPSASSSTSSSTSPTTITPALQAEFDQLDCTKPFPTNQRPQDIADKPLVTCDRTQQAKYILAPVVVPGSDVTSAAANFTSPQNGIGQWVVDLSFNGAGTRQFATVTQQLVNNPSPTNQFAIVLDGVVVSAPVVQSAIVDGNAQITGQFTQQEATDLANVLKYGALPLAFDTGQVQSISASLGSNQLKAGIVAGLLGLALVVVYLLFYYRGLGLVAAASLVLAALLTYGLLVLLGHTIGYTLTLAGIAGAIVAIGITADSFVVFFERIRDEMRDGRSMKVAVETGWRRARRTILAADAVSLIAAIVLYVLSVGGVRGFAFTLGLTTILDVFIVFFFTKPLMTVLARTTFFGGGHPLSGVDPRRLGVRPPIPPLRRPAATPVTEEA